MILSEYLVLLINVIVVIADFKVIAFHSKFAFANPEMVKPLFERLPLQYWSSKTRTPGCCGTHHMAYDTSKTAMIII